jgi:hypothetical protein
MDLLADSKPFILLQMDCSQYCKTYTQPTAYSPVLIVSGELDLSRLVIWEGVEVFKYREIPWFKLLE